MNSAKGGRIKAAIARLMAENTWAWRYGDLPADESARHATIRLRDEYSRCQAWVGEASATIGLALPLGNGTNGPWHRTGVLDADGHFGVSDIAAGRILWTDAVAPSYVRRFALATTRSHSPHMAGGTGAVTSATRQIVVTLTSGSGSHVRIVKPKPTPTLVTWGLQTCYGDCGAPIDETDWRQDWKPFAAVPQREVEEPQWCEIPLGKGVDAEMWDAYEHTIPYKAHTRGGLSVSRFARRHSGGNFGSLHYVYVQSHRSERDEIIDYHQRGFREFIRARAIRAAADFMDRNSYYTNDGICGVVPSSYLESIIRMLSGSSDRINVADVCQDMRNGK